MAAVLNCCLLYYKLLITRGTVEIIKFKKNLRSPLGGPPPFAIVYIKLMVHSFISVIKTFYETSLNEVGCDI